MKDKFQALRSIFYSSFTCSSHEAMLPKLHHIADSCILYSFPEKGSATSLWHHTILVWKSVGGCCGGIKV